MANEFGNGNFGGGIFNLGFDSSVFGFALDRVYPLKVTFVTDVFEKEDGTEQRNSLLPRGLHLFELKLFARTDDERQELLNFYNIHQGLLGDFTFVDPVTTSNFNVRFEESLLFEKRADTLWDITVGLQEIL